MNGLYDTRPGVRRSGERGGARLSFLTFLFVLAVAGYGGYQYVPVAYKASLFKVFMQDTVDKAAAAGKSTDWVANQIRANGHEYGVPPEAILQVTQQEGRIEARVRYSRPIPLPGYLYQFDFDHRVKSNGLLTIAP